MQHFQKQSHYCIKIKSKYVHFKNFKSCNSNTKFQWTCQNMKQPLETVTVKIQTINWINTNSRVTLKCLARIWRCSCFDFSSKPNFEWFHCFSSVSVEEQETTICCQKRDRAASRCYKLLSVSFICFFVGKIKQKFKTIL